MSDDGGSFRIFRVDQRPTAGTDHSDDQFGGPEPDDAHITGVILRLYEDGSAPTDNPFFDASAAIVVSFDETRSCAERHVLLE